MAIFNSLGSNYTAKHVAHPITGWMKRNAKGELTNYLEHRYSAYTQLTYKGREAIYIALKNAQLPENAEVAISGYTCYAVYDAVVRAGYTPVYVDIAHNELNYSAKALENAVQKHKQIAAVIVQNTLGTPADIDGILAVAKAHRLYVLEDLAHSIGMHYENEKEAGTVADAALSFSQDKSIDAVSGGAFVSKKKFAHHKHHKLSYFRFLKDYYYIWNTMIIRNAYFIGFGKLYNWMLRTAHLLPKPMDGLSDDVREMDDWHASLALKQFADLPSLLRHRQQIASIYRDCLPKRVQFRHSMQATYLRFPIHVTNRKELIAYLRTKNFHLSDVWYESPISPKRELANTNYREGSCPNAEKVAAEMVNLPTHLNMTVDDAEKLCEEINAWLSKQN